MKVFLFILTFTLALLFFVRPFLLVGWSMYPTIGPVALAVCDGKNFTVNDIILFRYGNRAIAHRVIAISNDTIICKGDGNPPGMIEIIKDKDVICKIRVIIWGG